MKTETDTFPAGASLWATLYRTGAIAALALSAVIVIQIVIFVASPPPPSFDPTPEAVPQWFALLQKNALLGLIEMDALMIVDYVLLLVAYLALLAALWPANRSLMTIGALIAFASITIYFTTNPSLAMLALSNGYAAAATDAQRAGYVAAGQGALAVFRGTAFVVHYILMGVAGIIVSWVMLKSTVFSRATAYAGLLQGVLMLVPSTAGAVGIVFAFASLVPFVIWFVLVARRLLALAAAA